MSGPVFSIAPHADFLDTLAQAILDGRLLGGYAQDHAFWLSDVTVLLPTRRARQALAARFVALTGGATLLPDIRTLGGELGEQEPFLPPVDAPALPVAAGAAERTLYLAERIRQVLAVRGEQRPDLTSSAALLGVARALGEIVDDMALEEIAPEAVRGIDLGELSGHWQQSLELIELALTDWPVHLARTGRADARQVARLALDRQTGALAALFGDRPVIAAGSTGSVKAAARLMKGLLGLRRGAVVLPGFDPTLGDQELAALGDAARLPHGHPHYLLARFVRTLGVQPGEITELSTGPAPARTAMVRRALALAEATADWPAQSAALGPDALHAATAGMVTLAAPTEDMEARAVAVAARAAHAEGLSVGIVSNDRNLARRIARELARFDIEADDSAGTPLFQSPAGRLARLVLEVGLGAAPPVALMALLNNRMVTLGGARPRLAADAQLLDLSLLRGQRPADGFDGLLKRLDAIEADPPTHAVKRLDAEAAMRVRRLLTDLAKAFAPLIARRDTRFEAADLVAQLVDCLGALGAGAEQDLPGWRELLALNEQLAASPVRGPHLDAAQGVDALTAVLAELMAGHSMRPPQTGRDDVAIWGRLEARLMRRDVMILCGLNEGVWPEVADPGPWLNRKMRLEAGFEAPERQQGQAAHDFEQLLGHERVILSWSARRGTSPADPSRLVQRLRVLMGPDAAAQMQARGAALLADAEAIDRAGGPARAMAPPAPCPPAALRPKSLSVTEAEELMRSPYSLYARHVLGLRPIPALGKPTDAADIGSFTHQVFGDFIAHGHDVMGADAHDTLMALAAEAFAPLSRSEGQLQIRLRRFGAQAEAFLAFERARNAEIAARHAEIDGRIVLPRADGELAIRGRADRVDVRHDGGIELIDFKTGAVPSKRDMTDLMAPQLPLEARMAALGGFKNVLPGQAAALTYIKLGASEADAFGLTPFGIKGLPLEAAIDASVDQVMAVADAFLFSDSQPMMPNRKPRANQRFAGDYDHLVRAAEWSDAGLAEDDGEGEA